MPKFTDAERNAAIQDCGAIAGHAIAASSLLATQTVITLPLRELLALRAKTDVLITQIAADTRD